MQIYYSKEYQRKVAENFWVWNFKGMPPDNISALWKKMRTEGREADADAFRAEFIDLKTKKPLSTMELKNIAL